MSLILQVWGGGFYLLSKLFLALGEGRQRTSSTKTWGWVFYLTGLPAWIVILVLEKNWITAAIELGSAPSMMLGLTLALSKTGEAPAPLEKLSLLFAYALIPLGVGYSLYDYGGLTSVTQALEVGAVVGFLGGTYLLAKAKRSGWLLFVFMNASVALLMLIQDIPVLVAQQLLSLCFSTFGYIRSGRKGEEAKQIPSHSS